MDDFDKFFNTGKICYNMLKYIPGLTKIGYQGKLSGTEENMQMNLTKIEK